jgi:hypothetical protein
MAITYPLFCASHTVRGTCTIGTLDGAGANDTVTLAEGVYWSDPKTVGHATELLTQVNALIEAGDGGSFGMSAAYNAQTLGRYTTTWEAASSSSGKFRPAGANTEGLRVYQRLGVSRTRNSTNTFFQVVEGGPPFGVWAPGNRAELLPSWTHDDISNAASTVPSLAGKAWTFSTGQPARRRLIELNQVDRAYVVAEAGEINVGDVDEDNDYSFKTLMWPYLSRGEMVRVYSDRDATTTYLTADVSATATTFPVGSGTGIADGDTVWLDGEKAWVISGGGTSTLTVERPDAWAHDAGAPVSKAHVATYVLDSDGGNINIGGFTPRRRAANQPRYDLAIALMQTRFTED